MWIQVKNYCPLIETSLVSVREFLIMQKVKWLPRKTWNKLYVISIPVNLIYDCQIIQLIKFPFTEIHSMNKIYEISLSHILTF